MNIELGLTIPLSHDIRLFCMTSTTTWERLAELSDLRCSGQEIFSRVRGSIREQKHNGGAPNYL